LRLLLDTNVLSEIRRPDGNAAVKAALSAADEVGLFVSVLTLGEIRQGIELLPQGAKRRALAAWLGELRDRYADRVLAIDAVVTDAWGVLNARLRRAGCPVPAVDGLLAATALTHGLAIATRNVRDFEGTGVDLFDPWNDSLPV
jgi:predicted nucleic acid-binding protein